MERKLLIFNCDGVLVNTMENFLEREIKKQLEGLGYHFLKTREDFEDLFEENIGISMIDRGVSPSHICTIWDNVQKVIKRTELKLYPGIKELLKRLSSQWKLAIISSNSEGAVRHMLASNGVLSRFMSVSGGQDDVTKVERLKRCVRDAKANPEEVFFIGGTVADIDEAHEAGLKAIAVTWGLHARERLATAHPEGIVKTPEALYDLISALRKA